MNPEINSKLLQELLCAYGPSGQEDDVRAICRRELDGVADEVWVDDAGNVVAMFGGETRTGPPVRVLAHMDELSMLVKRVNPDGTLHLTHLGTMYPANFGLGPVTVVGNHQTLCGVLALGSEHTTRESTRIWETKPDGGGRALDWSDVYVFTGHTTAELSAAGVRAGSRVCIDRSKRQLIEVGDYLGCYFMDDRAALAVLLATASALAEQRPVNDTYLVCTVSEEVGGIGGTHAARQLPDGLTLAVEVGPTEYEYGTTVAGGPIIAYSDAQCVYDKALADRLMDIAVAQGAEPQPAVLGAFESDASHAKAVGVSGPAGLICLPTLSTHGYEVIARQAIPTLTAVLVEFLRLPGPV